MKNLKTPIYLDYAATTPVDKSVADKMMACLAGDERGIFGNPGSNHIFGEHAKKKVEDARQQMADCLHITPRRIIFTSGATEANNLAIQGVAHFYKTRGKHIITSQTEHKSVLEPCAYLEQQGFTVTYLKPNRNGLVNLNELEAAFTPETILVSIMHVNNETGVIQDIAKIGQLTRKSGIFFHVDAVQSLGKLPISIDEACIDLLSMSAHKIYGPKGIGALVIGDTPRVRLIPLLHGGGQERRFRAGTLPTHQIVGMSEALVIANANRADEQAKIKTLRDQFWAGISDLPFVYWNGQNNLRGEENTQILPNILNVRFENMDKKKFLVALKDLAISSSSACNTITIEPSHVLQAMGLSVEEADHSFRFSFGRFTTQEEIEYAIQMVRKVFFG